MVGTRASRKTGVSIHHGIMAQILSYRVVILLETLHLEIYYPAKHLVMVRLRI